MITKKRFIPHLVAEVIPSTEDFAKLLESVDTSHVKEGSVVKGQVIETSAEVIVVDVGLKNESRIPISEFQVAKGQEFPKIGDIVDVFVERIEGRRGTVLSREKAIQEESWFKLEKLFESQKNVTGTIFGRVKGGFTVNLEGVIAFLPGSQSDVRPIKDLTTIMDIPQPFQILKMDRALGNIVVSRKAVLEESRSKARDKMLSTLKEGDVLTGVVKNITDYGAFVDLGSIDGLLHVTDISWSRINHPSEVLTFCQEIRVMVIKFNEVTKRISLGMKQLHGNPWENITEEFPVEKVAFGKITNIADYGVFIELKDGVEGLVHSSEIFWGKTNQNHKKILTVGQEVEFMILDVDPQKRRISLSIKKCQDNPLIKFADENPVGSVIKVPIRNITDFGMFVAIDANTDGMIHESDLSWEGNGTELLKNYNKSDQVKCKVLNIDIEKDRVALGIKQLTDDPYEGSVDNFKKKMVITCVVTNTNSDGIEVNVDNKASGFIKKVELASERSEQKPNRFAKGDRVDAKIISIDKSNRKLALSIKALETDIREKAIKEYGSADSGASLGTILGTVLAKNKSENKK